MATHPAVQAIFHEHDDALEAVDKLVDAHVPARDIEVTADDGWTIPVRHRNHMAKTALLGGVAGLILSMVWLGVGTSGMLSLPVMDRIVDAVGPVGAGLRLGFLGVAVGTVAGALGGIRTRVTPVDDGHLQGAQRIVVSVDRDDDATIDALRDADPDRLLLFDAQRSRA